MEETLISFQLEKACQFCKVHSSQYSRRSRRACHDGGGQLCFFRACRGTTRYQTNQCGGQAAPWAVRCGGGDWTRELCCDCKRNVVDVWSSVRLLVGRPWGSLWSQDRHSTLRSNLFDWTRVNLAFTACSLAVISHNCRIVRFFTRGRSSCLFNNKLLRRVLSI